jgi:penicillin-binding protein 1C
MKRWLKKYRHFLLGTVVVLAVAFYFMLPNQLFKTDYSTVVYSRHGDLLGARIAADGQWRFPPHQELPATYKTALLTFEDKHFYRHPGIDPFALARALKANIQAGHVVQGGSTITMQVVRMALENQPRTYGQKLKEMILALRIELAYSKEEILLLYAAHAPFGGNVVGLEAASWRYFSRPPHALSHAEYALLAVLPNAPSAMRPGKNRADLLAKRNRLLGKLHDQGKLSDDDYRLALLEPLPAEPNPLPDITPHISQYALNTAKGKVIQTTINKELQLQTGDILNHYYLWFRRNGVHNAGILVADVVSGEVLVYHGNTPAGSDHGQFVDVCRAPRSSGSILKPFLYNAMLQSGQLLPDQLVPDIPTFLSGFKPENYARVYEGAVPASEALARSLNVPAVLELKQFGVSRFKTELHEHGFTTVNRSADNYGLSLILGGAEVTLWDVCQAYLGMAQNVLRAQGENDLPALRMIQDATQAQSPKKDPAAAYLTLEALRTANHNYRQSGIHEFASNNIAWKTGTSYGFRDAWAVGVDANYVVAVWVGNADGEGRPGVIGAEAAAPIMFKVFDALPKQRSWFAPPYLFMQEIETCARSGLLASKYCPEKQNHWCAQGAANGTVCSYHQPVLVTVDKTFRLKTDCAAADQAIQQNWFVLPPAMEYYYKKVHPGYEPLPPLAKSCPGEMNQKPMQLIYPTNYQKVYSAKQLDGKQGPVVFKLAHREADKRVFWHANDTFLGETSGIHDLPVTLSPGTYTLKVVDEDGFELTQELEVL